MLIEERSASYVITLYRAALARAEALEHQRGDLSLEIVRSNETAIELQQMYTKAVETTNLMTTENTAMKSQVQGIPNTTPSMIHLATTRTNNAKRHPSKRTTRAEVSLRCNATPTRRVRGTISTYKCTLINIYSNLTD